MIIDITKKYTTRSGLPVRIYAVDGAGFYPIHGATQENGGWLPQVWGDDGSHSKFVRNGGTDLIPVKTWRAWTIEEAPSFFMARTKLLELVVVEKRPSSCPNVWFHHYTRIHEDGSETPCGAEAP